MRLNTVNDVQNLWSAATAAAALGAAIESGLLWLLAEKPRNAEEIVQELSIPGKRGFYWLQLLEQLGILEKSPQGYLPSPLAKQAILDTRSQNSWKHLVVDERERIAGISSLAPYLREPGSIWAAQGLAKRINYVEKMRTDPGRAREFTRMLFEVHQALAETVSGYLDLTGVQRLMDLGGGSGVVSMALLRKYPALQATVVDIANVCEAGREVAAEVGLGDRIRYYPAEFAFDEFPTGFEVILKCDVSIFGEWLFRKLWKSLDPGGRLVFVEHLSPTEDSAPPTRVEWTFLDSLDDPYFSIPTFDQVKSMLAQTGFQILPGQHTFGSGWIIFQARKVS